MREVKFKFDLDQKVHSELAGNGVVGMLAMDDGGVTYYVKLKVGDRWMRERELTANWKSDPLG